MQDKLRCVVVLLTLLVAVAIHAAELPVAPLSVGGTLSSQTIDSGASDGTDFLFVWMDEDRGGRRATRVSRDGQVLDHGGIALPGVTDRSSVVWTGTSYLVLWNEDYPSRIRALRISRDGHVIDGPRTLKNEAYMTSVATNGTHVVLAHHGHQPPFGAFDKRALFVDADAQVKADIRLDAPGNNGTLTIAWNGALFAAVWIDDQNPDDAQYAVEGIRFTSGGPIDAAPRLLFTGSGSGFISAPELSSGGGDFVLLSRQGSGWLARRISSDLASIGGAQTLPALQYEPLYRSSYSSPIAWNGSHYLVFGHDGQTLHAVRLDRDGRTVDDDTIETTAGTGTLAGPVGVTNGRDFLVAWNGAFSTEPGIGTDVFGTLASASTLQPRARTLITVSLQHQRRPVVASGGTNLLTVWQEGAALVARRLLPDGSPLDPTPLRLAERGTPSAVVFNGSDYIVVWPRRNEYHQLLALHTARIPRDGALRVEGASSIAGATPLGLASNGVTTLLLWHKDDRTRVSRIAADASIQGSLALSGSVEGATLAAGDGAFLLVWEETRPHPHIITPPVTISSLRAMRVSPELVSLDGNNGVELVGFDGDARQPAAAWNGTDWLVVWTSYGTGGDATLRGRFVSRNAVPQGSANGIRLASRASFSSLAWDGNRFFLTWSDNTVRPWEGGWVATIHSAYLDRHAQADSRQPQVGERVSDSQPVWLAPIRPGVIAAAYARPVAEPAYGDVARAFVNLLASRGKQRAVR